MKLKQILLVVLISAASAIGSVWVYGKFINKNQASAQTGVNNGKLPVNYAGFNENAAQGIGEGLDFTKAANAAVPAVVHIQTKTAAKKVTNNLSGGNRDNEMDDFFDQFFDMGPRNRIQPEQRASGSGVIISDDGYIVTNNHVVSEPGGGVADEITITLSNKKTYKAKLIGKDPSTDIAVIKVDATALPYLVYGNSDNLKLGQWVMAVGYPLTLETTVTAGIVSAKGRNIRINERQSDTPIESFIQTDAAVNQGNSGGALINTDGQLVGINSAIYAPTGTYAGYSFAIPVNLAKKIVNDLIKFGSVKKPYLGVSAADGKFDAGDGAHIGLIAPDGAAAEAGLKKGDIITKINDSPINSWTELQGSVISNNVGDKIKITYLRGNKEYSGTAVLKSKQGDYAEVAKSDLNGKLGAELETISKEKAKEYGINGGVRVKKITNDNSPIGRTRIDNDFIITSINDAPISNVEELSRILGRISGVVRVEGVYPGSDGTYTFPLSLKNDD